MPPPCLVALLVALIAAGATTASASASASPRPPKERASPPGTVAASPKGASWDEVNLLAHAVLQLGHGLKEHVDRTRGQVRDLRARLGAHEDALGRLQSAAAEAEDAAEAGAPAPHHGNRTGGAPGDLAALQNLVGLQNEKIEDLFQKIKQQQYRMDKQSMQIKSLQSKVNMMLPLYAKGAEMEKISKQKASSPRGHDLASNRSQDVNPTLPEVPRFPLGCHQLFPDGSQRRGVFRIQPPGSQPFDVLCDPSPGGGGWTVIQKRQDGSVDFDQLWEAYKNGFGNLSGDFWLGLEKTHQIVRQGRFRSPD
ncbi:hypothetical protein JRQ81_008722 [Phrynocephalus forsythii]|uniref:Fibrinogen C-terminal domain-containing protein n=1 Tax=Phrynocephalus forsythii TaxID=171643 RepID=A0A9Q0XAR2_9SAUR|nr:hypothetical protein JRQ81_008722 [Phrynocephalus forsythii]